MFPKDTSAQTTTGSFQHKVLDLGLGFVTAPVLIGLVILDWGKQWLRQASFADQGWWSESHLPVLSDRPKQEAEPLPDSSDPMVE
jgi:hypothetical protein